MYMTNANPVRFTLNDNTVVVVKEVTNNKYDFEMILPNGNRKTFLWLSNTPGSYEDKKGNIDKRITEAIGKFSDFKKLSL
jgi:hypothetical protein